MSNYLDIFMKNTKINVLTFF